MLNFVLDDVRGLLEAMYLRSDKHNPSSYFFKVILKLLLNLQCYIWMRTKFWTIFSYFKFYCYRSSWICTFFWHVKPDFHNTFWYQNNICDIRQLLKKNLRCKCTKLVYFRLFFFQLFIKTVVELLCIFFCFLLWFWLTEILREKFIDFSF